MSYDAEQIVHRIESRVRYVLQRLQFASVILLQNLDLSQRINVITAQDLEKRCVHWKMFVPDDAETKAKITQILIDRFTMSPDLPIIAATLGFEDADVQAAYYTLYNEDLLTALRNDAASEDNPNEIQQDIIDALDWRYLQRGEVLLKQGETGDGLYILLDGLLQVQIADDDNITPDKLGEIEPGQFVGEMALLTEDTHNATVIARQASGMAFLSQALFDELVVQHPQLMRLLALQIIDRLRSVYAPPIRYDSVQLFALVPPSSSAEPFGQLFVDQLSRYGTLQLLTPASATAQTAERRVLDFDEWVEVYEFSEWFNQLKYEYDIIVCFADADYPNWTRRIFEDATRVLIVRKVGSDSEGVSATEALLSQISKPELAPPTELILLQDTRHTLPSQTRHWLTSRHVQRHHHVALHNDADYDRLARYLQGKAVGVVFGGGGMRGAAHAGVIQAMNELGIYADIAGGTSAGAIVAAQYGLEWSVEKIMQETKDRLLKRSTIFEFTFPFTSFATGYKLNQELLQMFDGVEIEDMWRPAFTIASNLTQAKMTVMDTGSLHRAVRASISLAGIFPPTVDVNNDLLLDGGGFNNTPADVMRDKVGHGKVIAVDMGFTKREFPKYNYGDSLNGFRVLLNRLNFFGKQRITAPTIMDIIMRSNALWSIQATQQQVAHADIILSPPVQDYGLYDFDSADEIFDRGYQYALKRLREWKDSGGLD